MKPLTEARDIMLRYTIRRRQYVSSDAPIERIASAVHRSEIPLIVSRRPGRPPKVDPARVTALRALGKTTRQIMAATALSRATIYRALGRQRFNG